VFKVVIARKQKTRLLQGSRNSGSSASFGCALMLINGKPRTAAGSLIHRFRVRSVEPRFSAQAAATPGYAAGCLLARVPRRDEKWWCTGSHVWRTGHIWPALAATGVKSEASGGVRGGGLIGKGLGKARLLLYLRVVIRKRSRRSIARRSMTGNVRRRHWPERSSTSSDAIRSDRYAYRLCPVRGGVSGSHFGASGPGFSLYPGTATLSCPIGKGINVAPPVGHG
jgi:hypothetical protein